MRVVRTVRTNGLVACSSAVALALGLLGPAHALAQTTPAGATTPAEQAGANESGNEAEVVVTGSRIARAGFDQPTPTTIVGDVELRQGQRESLQQALNEQPQIRNTTAPTTQVANTGSGTAPVDLRGLGSNRTLTLINGRRFVGDNNLNFVPTSLVERVEVVTGGAAAAYGSGAVAGVVNIILNDKLDGLTLGANTGISSRGDGFRYGFEGSFGTSFGGGAGHFLIGGEYVNQERIGSEGFDDRPFFGADFVAAPGGRRITPNISTNLVVAGSPVTFGGTALTGPLAGRVFNPDGSVRAATPADFINVYKTINISSPLERIASYARLTYDLGGPTVFADVSYGRSHVDQPFLPDTASSSLAFNILATNPFLAPSVRSQLGTATSFLLGRLSADTAFLQFEGTRETIEGAIGINGTFGGDWRYRAHFSHGEIDSRQRVSNSFISGGTAGGRFARAINAVQTPGGIVCAVNADAVTTNDDPSCVAFNPFGVGAASQAARNYVTGTQSLDGTNKLDSLAAELQGDLFSLWAGPITIAVGVEARWEEQENVNGELDRQSVAGPAGPVSIFGTPLFFSPVSGGTSVKEAFGEALVPLVASDDFKVELNGAARYSDYNLSGGIWSWKVGGTASLFNTFLLRGTRSRDIRAPGIGELFAQNTLNIRSVIDRDTSRCVAAAGCNSRPTVTLLTSGNPDLQPEVSDAWTVGASFSPQFFRGFNLSVDYYDIEINDAIQSPDTADITVACLQGDQASCALVDRAANGTITTVRARQANIASLQTNGVDIEASYVLPLSQLSSGMGGTMRFRGLATYVDKLLFQTPACVATNTCRETAGSVGDTVVSGLPHWRANFSATYQGESVGVDLRVRYVGGGKFDKLDTTILNNDVKSRTYVDLGAQFKVMDDFTFLLNVRNLFDRDPPLSIQLGGIHYDTIGRYFTAGARVKF